MELEEILNLERQVYAHKPSEEGNKQKETLEEHTKRSEKYFLRLLEKGKMRDSFETMIPILLGNVSEECKAWFRKTVFGVISFHDTGKINPKFQYRSMENPEFEGIEIRNLDNSNHSLLSAYFYLDYFLAQLEEMKEKKVVKINEYLYLNEILFVNAYLILKHHSTLNQCEQMISLIQNGGRLNSLDKQIKAGDYKELYKGGFLEKTLESCIKVLVRVTDSEDRKFAKYTYSRLMFSLLTASDYYATNEYATGNEMNNFGSIQEINDLYEIYENTEIAKTIRNFQPDTAVDDGNDINYLRNKLFYEAESNLKKHADHNIFFLEAPTGCGKSNVAFASSFLLTKQGMEKIIYVYPFNNLVEQNKLSIEEIFKGYDVLEKVAVINSITPIKCEIQKKKKYDDEILEYYKQALLDRQFLNYPVLLTTHVNLFQTMFGTQREALFGFHQLVGSVIVLDEIQSYKNTLWTEIMMFLQYFCKYLHCKILIMSATLPNLTLLTGKEERVCRLIRNRDYYFKDKRFRDRVRISFELLKEEFSEEVLYEHVKRQSFKKKKIVIEFIKKKSAYRFFERLKKDEEVQIPIALMTGDNNSVERLQILKRVRDDTYCKEGFILVATQVIEAGVDIDMDIGYKDISILDSEEQFMGRINRNSKRNGIVYFFNLCDASSIYGKNDFRSSYDFTLQNEEMQKILVNKEFSVYYERVLKVLQSLWNKSSGKEGIRTFVEREVGKLDFMQIEKRMQLIEEDTWTMSIFLARELQLSDGEYVHGHKVWEEYKQILQKPQEDYAKFRVELSRIQSKLNLFIYKIKKNSNLNFNDRIGSIYYLENGEDFFEDGVLNKDRLEESGGLFIEI